MKYNIENLTNTSINIPWGVKVNWALLTSKLVSKDITMRHIILGAIYVKPKSRKKTATTDHTADVYNTLRSKYGKGLFWILAGDTNELKLGPILRLNSNLRSIVKKKQELITRIHQKAQS